MQILRLIWESLKMAVQSVTVNRLRATLSLLGITIGIFAIIAVFTIVDSLETNIRESVDSLGSDVLYVEKWPWAPPEGENEYPWWKYMNRPLASFDEFEYLRDYARGAKNSAFVAYVGRRIDHGNNTIDGAGILGATDGFKDIRSFELEKGRYFSPIEIKAGRNVTVIGYTIAQKLFEGANPIGKHIEIFGSKVLVIGVVEKEGKGTFSGMILDDVALLPLQFFTNYIDIRRDFANPQIINCLAAVGQED